MKNKILFLIIFLFILLFFPVAVKGFSIVHNGKTIDFGAIDDKLYNFIYVLDCTSAYSTSHYRIITVDNAEKEHFYIKKYNNTTYLPYSDANYRVFVYHPLTPEEGTALFSEGKMGSDWETKYMDSYNKSPSKFIYSNFDIYDNMGEIVVEKTVDDKITLPFIFNWSEIETGLFDNIFVYTGSKYSVYDDISFSVFEGAPFYTDENEFLGYYSRIQKKEILNADSSYLSDYFVDAELGGMYIVPRSVFFNLKNNYQYEFKLTVGGEVVFDKVFVMGEISAEQQEQYDKDKELALQEEQNKTSKGIWDTLKEVLSYLNPFSENFFVYKLIELLVNAIKALFVPSEDFFTNFATDMSEWLSDRLGILYYPIDLVVDFLEKISELGDSKTAVISWPNFEFMGADLIKSGSYDLYSLVNDNDTFKNIHSIYLVFVDVILWLGLVFLAKNTFVDIFGGKYDVDDVISSSSSHDNRALAQTIKNREDLNYKRRHLR